MASVSRAGPRVGGADTTYHAYAPIVRRLARSVARRLPSGVTTEDVVAAGWLGLSEALQRRTERMTEDEFEAYASHRIRGAILDHLRKLDPMTRRLRAAARCALATRDRLQACLGRPPEPEELACELGMSLAEYHRLQAEIGDPDSVPLEGVVGQLSAGCGASPEAMVSNKELLEALAAAATALPARQQLLLGLYYGDEYTLREIGKRFGVTESRVSQLHGEALRRLRAAVGSGAARGPAPARGVPCPLHDGRSSGGAAGVRDTARGAGARRAPPCHTSQAA